MRLVNYNISSLRVNKPTLKSIKYLIINFLTAIFINFTI